MFLMGGMEGAKKGRGEKEKEVSLGGGWSALTNRMSSTNRSRNGGLQNR